LKLIQGELTKIERSIAALTPQRDEILGKLREAQSRGLKRHEALE
jgi:hypothetical protein